MKYIFYIWEWLGEEKNLKRTTFALPLTLGLFGGVFGLGIWLYNNYSVDTPSDEIVIDLQGTTASNKEVNLKTALMLKDLGDLRLADGDYLGAERSFDFALSLIDKEDITQEFHFRYLLYQKVILYREMDKTELYMKTLADYDALFSKKP